MKSNEYDIRKSVVQQLLVEGIKRENIRIEIPLDTASSTGRADIVVLTDKLLCIELKSGKDKFSPEALKAQCQQYNRSFDACGTIIDVVHRKEMTEEINGTTYHKNNWATVDIQYCHATGKLQGCYGDAITSLLDNYEYRFRSYKTSVYDMACLLWASEVKVLCGFKSKSSYTSKMREEGRLCDVRPIVTQALRSRPLNCWEKRFWKAFDDEALATPIVYATK